MANGRRLCFAKKLKRKRIAKKPTTAAEKKPIANVAVGRDGPAVWRRSSSAFAPAPRMRGKARRKEKRAESLRRRPRKRPVEIVKPDREKPAMSPAAACARPIARASIPLTCERE